MDRRKALGVAAALVAAVVLGGCGKEKDSFRPQLMPIVSKVSEVVKGAAGLMGSPPSQILDRTDGYLTDLAGLVADIRSLTPQTEEHRAWISSATTYAGATQRFINAQQEFARALMRLDAARAKVKDSLEAKARTSKFSLDFWKETHDKLTAQLEGVRKDALAARDKLVLATTSMQQSVEAAAATLGTENVASPEALIAHRKALDAVPVATDP